MDQDVYDILDSKPEIAKENDYINKLYKENRDRFEAQDRAPIKVAMLTDLHLDYDYTPGMNT